MEACGPDEDAAYPDLAGTSQRITSVTFDDSEHMLADEALTASESRYRLHGSVATSGATGKLLERSLHGLQQVIDRSLADVCLTAGLQLRHETIALDQLVSEIRIPVVMEAFTRRLVFSSAVEKGLTVDADRQMLSSAIANLLQNALKFTRPHGRLSLTAKAMGDRAIIEITDECCGLPEGKSEELFKPFDQQEPVRSGLGLGLSLSRRSIEANGGTLGVRDVPGTGCIFAIDLPKSSVN